ncbi:MAG: hypothetical protein DRK00_10065, partial [Thermoprotei archaeon]
WMFLILAGIEAVNLASYILESLGFPNSAFNVLRPLDQGVFYSLHWLSPLLYPLLTTWWLAALSLQSIKPWGEVEGWGKIERWRTRLLLLLVLALAFYVGLTPYLPFLNPQGRYVGMDAVRYEEMIVDFSNEYLARSDRPLMQLILYAVSRLIGVEATVKALPLACSTILAAASYMFVKEYLRSRLAALVAALLAVASPTTTIALFAGFYSNWLSYSVSLMALTLALKSRSRRGLKLPVLTVLLALTSMFLHPYHWAIVTFTSTLLLVEAVARRSVRDSVAASLLAAPQLLAFPLLELMGFNPVMVYTRRFLEFLLEVASNPLLAYSAAMPTGELEMDWWEAVFFFSYSYAGGGLIDTPLLVLALLGVLVVATLEDWFKRGMLLYWLVPCAFLMLVTPHARNMLEIPTYIYAALGLIALQKLLDKVSKEHRYSAIIAILMLQACYAIRQAMFTTYILAGG